MRTSKIMLVFVLSLLLFNIVQAQSTVLPSAAKVFGQADFSANKPGHSANGLNFPLGIAVDKTGGFYVADRNNQRVVYFASDGDAKADRVYGQFGKFDSYTMNFDGVGGSAGAPSADSLSMPTGVSLDANEGLYIADRENHRALYFAPDGNTTADKVFGQFGNFTTNPANNDSKGMAGTPSAENIGVYALCLFADKQGGLYISDSSNNRVLYFAPDGDTKADRVFGQFGSFDSGTKNNDGKAVSGSPSADSLNFPRGLTMDDQGGLYLADRENNRILYFANDGDTKADRVYGQFGSFTTGVANNDGSGSPGKPSAESLSSPRWVGLDANNGLFVADSNNNRVLYFANDGDTKADRVFGQFGSFITGVPNNDGKGNSGTPGADNLNVPQALAVGGDGQLFISDTNNNRVLVIEKPG